jgi:hypothetical protein
MCAVTPGLRRETGDLRPSTTSRCPVAGVKIRAGAAGDGDGWDVPALAGCGMRTHD